MTKPQQQQQPKTMDDAIRSLAKAEETIKQLRMELLIYGFAAAKAIARLRRQATGTMSCPLCQQMLAFSTAECNGHFSARCKTQDCINATE